MTVEASPIKHHAVSTSSAGGLQVWNEFVAQGPSYWAEVHPPKLSLQTSQEMHELWNEELKSADPTSYPSIAYLLWRRALDPPRFDHWHQRLGQALQSLLAAPSSVPHASSGSTSAAQQLVPPTLPPAPSPDVLPASVAPEAVPSHAAVIPSPASIPEPETLTLAVVLFASEVCRRLRNGRWRAKRSSH
jgi:hypothetical protein